MFDEQFSGHFGERKFTYPLHAAWEGQKLNMRNIKSEEAVYDEGIRNKGFYHDQQNLIHFKLSFPVFRKEVSDRLEWLRDCEEYFAEVSDRRRAAIAAMRLSGTPRSRILHDQESFMIGKERATWQQYKTFLATFGEIDAMLVFEKFKRLQQLSTAEAYYVAFEKCGGQLLKKIPSLANEYFLENCKVRFKVWSDY